MIILGIESSCDETSASLLKIEGGNFEQLNNVISSSEKIQAKYGGVVPEVAARKQMEYMIPVMQEVLSGVSPDQIEALAVTVGPGLATSLQVGIDTAKSLAYLWQKPIIPVNHLEGHLYSPLLNNPNLEFPAVGLIVSGGHTELILLRGHLDYQLLGRTRDDAAGEAFDKAAKLLGLGYPGGPTISKPAEQGNPEAYNFPRGMINSPDYDFSFSGIKTSILYAARDDETLKSEEKLPDVAASFQKAVVDVLVAKSKKAVLEHDAKTLLVGGGVSANPLLRQTLIKECKLLNVNCHLSPQENTGDNAAMIALAGYLRYQKGDFIKPNPQSKEWQAIKAMPNLKLV